MFLRKLQLLGFSLFGFCIIFSQMSQEIVQQQPNQKWVSDQDYIQSQVSYLESHNCECKDFENLLSCRKTQLEVMDYFLHARNTQTETVEQQNEIILKFLGSYLLGLQNIDSQALDVLLEDLLIESGMLEPFIGPGGKVGVPSQVDDETVCDNMMELIRACGAAVVSVYLYANVQQKHGTFPPDHVASMFLALSLNTFQRESIVAQIDTEIQDSKGTFQCKDLQWLMKWCQADLAGRVATVYGTLGDDKLMSANRNTRQRSLLHLLKILPNCPTGYSLYCKSCLQNKQFEAGLLFANKGLEGAVAQRNKYEESLLLYLIILCLVAGGGKDGKWQKLQVKQFIQRAKSARETVQAYLPESVGKSIDIQRLSEVVDDQFVTSLSLNEGEQEQLQEPIELQELDLDIFPIPQGSMMVYD
eukprot:TRINITY_DN6912_c0_g1_i5.p1 TRINITY_DN6912_c0_g1~~TRINITY_DN6912_c0_g1_i5.p1  ORF type:complete len:432 (-),score=31.93 TRINITY_DN6912_c0_g1_i5:287-1534(-)